MSAIHQISVFLENRSGSLSEITALLAKSGINLRALSIAESADYGVLRIIADDAAKATDTLLKNGCVLSMTPVLLFYPYFQKYFIKGLTLGAVKG